MADLLTVLRAGRWSPLALTAVAAALALALSDHRADLVGALAVVIPVAVVWLVDDPAASVTASARWGRRAQLAVRCGLAVALAWAGWLAGTAYAGGSPRGSALVLAALLPVALAASVTWGAASGGPAAAVLWAAVTALPPRYAVTGARWWWVLAAGAAWLVVAARDPVRR